MTVNVSHHHTFFFFAPAATGDSYVPAATGPSSQRAAQIGPHITFHAPLGQGLKKAGQNDLPSQFREETPNMGLVTGEEPELRGGFKRASHGE